MKFLRATRIMKAAAVLLCCTSPTLLQANNLDNANSQAERFYQLNDNEDYLALYKLFKPDALIQYVLDFGIFYPNTEMRFRLNDPVQLDDWKASDDMGSYQQTRTSLTIGEATITDAGIQLTVVIGGEYQWDTEKGIYKTTDRFIFEPNANGLKITDYQSVTSF